MKTTRRQPRTTDTQAQRATRQLLAARDRGDIESARLFLAQLSAMAEERITAIRAAR